MLQETSLAAAVGVSVRNTQFANEAANLPRKILIMGTADPAKDVAPNVPQLILSPEDAGGKFGFGSMVHRLAVQTFAGSMGVETHVLPQDEAGGATAASGSIDFTTSANVKAGAINLYVANIPVRATAATDMTAAQIATALVAACTANSALPVSAAVDGVVQGKVNFTAKSKGPWGNHIALAFNLRVGQTLPAGVEAVVVAMSGGAGVPDVAAALDALGTGDSANEAGFTDVVHGYGLDTDTLDAISAYVGEGNGATGLYDNTVARPFRCLVGDTTADSAGLTALIAISDDRKLDRANGVLAVPGSHSHPAELAALAIGNMARINNDRVAQHYVGVVLAGADPGDTADRWTNDYDNRDLAVKSGISPTRVRNGVVTLQNVVTFYRPDDVPVASNGYRSMRNIAILQNMLAAVRSAFDQEKWQGISIVADTSRVSSAVDRQKVRDIDAVVDELMKIVTGFEGKAWVYEAAFTINRLKQPGAVTIRQGGLGFNATLPVLLSGEGGILNTTVEFDTSLAVLLG